MLQIVRSNPFLVVLVMVLERFEMFNFCILQNYEQS